MARLQAFLGASFFALLAASGADSFAQANALAPPNACSHTVNYYCGLSGPNNVYHYGGAAVHNYNGNRETDSRSSYVAVGRDVPSDGMAMRDTAGGYNTVSRTYSNIQSWPGCWVTFGPDLRIGCNRKSQ